MDERKLRILHISDIHYSKENKNTIDEKILKPLIKKIENVSTDNKVDLICITGDLIDKGGRSYDSPDIAFSDCRDEFILPLSKALNVKKENIILTIGNHDIIRDNDSKYAELGVANSLVTEDNINDFIHQNLDNNIPTEHKRLENYLKFEKEFYKDCKTSYCSAFFSKHERIINSIKICINCINSVWRYYDDSSKLLVGIEQIENEKIKFSDFDLFISLMHNEPELLDSICRKKIKNKLASNYKIQLYGHTHSRDAETVDKFCNISYFSSVSRGLLNNNRDTSDSDYKNGFSIIDYYIDKQELHYYPYIYNNIYNSFILDNAITCEKEYCKVQLKTADSEDIDDLNSIIEHLNNSVISGIDELMLSNGTDSIAPKTFDELFVEPRVSLHSEEDKLMTLQEIITNKENFALLGYKEIGKTVLLNYCNKYYLDTIHTLHKLPIFIDGKEKLSNDINTKIAKYWGISKKQVEHIFNIIDPVILIDNFDYKNKYFVDKIIKFLDSNKNAKLICTIPIPIGGENPAEFFESEIYKFVRVLDIKYFSHSQIKLLAKKWFSNETDRLVEQDDKIEKFLSLYELPRTPMSISMFLWISEKQSGYQPVNQATLLENFIEQILNKHDKSQEKYDSFDFKNKENLLTSIAFEMYKKANFAYSIKYSELIDYVENYLKSRTFDFIAEEIIDSLIDAGLLQRIKTDNSTYICFRFNCFFQFFLMKNMEENEDFRNEVLSEEKYLAFSEEIILYTGLKRNCSDILQCIVNRMDDLYKDIKETIFADKKTIDNYFETYISLLNQIKSEDVKSLKTIQNKEIKERYDKIQDELLEKYPIHENVKNKDFTLSKFEKLSISIVLGLNVLRNTEEVSIKDFKYDMYSRIMQNLLAFSYLSRVQILKTLQEEYGKLSKEKKEEAETALSFFPLCVSEILKDSIATTKLNPVFKKHITNILHKKDFSQLEKFYSVFLYIDSKGPESKSVLTEFIKDMRLSYIKDMTLLKLFFYCIKEENEQKRNYYLDEVTNVLEKKGTIAKQNKSKIRKKLKDDKLLREVIRDSKNV